MKKIYIICAFEDTMAKEFLPALEEFYIKPIDTYFNSQVILKIQEALMKSADTSVINGVKENWYESIKQEFTQEIRKVIEHKIINSKNNFYIYTPLNFFYIDLWRIIGKRLNVEVKFLVNWSKLDFKQSKEYAKNLKYKYHATYSLLKYSTYDCYFFQNIDFLNHLEITSKCLSSILNDENIFSNFTPVELLVQGLAEHNNVDNLKLPLEVETLLDIMKTLRFGTQYHEKIKKGDVGWDLLEKSIGVNSGIYAWFDLVAKKDNQPKDKLIQTFDDKKCKREMIESFTLQYEKFRSDNKVLRSRIEELINLQNKETISKTNSQNKVTPKKQPPKNTNKVPQKKNKVTSKVSKEEIQRRKKEKLKRDPYAYYNDSQKIYIRPLRFLYRRKK